MISERTFARSFSDFWAQLLPLLTPSFVHIINQGFRESLTDRSGVEIEAIPKNPKTTDSAVVAEFAFFLAQMAVEKEMRVDDVFQNLSLKELAERSALEVVTKYEGGRVYVPDRLSPEELDEGMTLARNYGLFFEQRCKGKRIEFGPEIPGAGFLSECKADISVETALFEVKTVDRNFAGKDIRQLIVYLALQGATGQRRWETAGFFNPRKAIYLEFEVDDLIQRMSGGKSSAEVFQDFVDFVCTRDIQFDAAF